MGTGATARIAKGLAATLLAVGIGVAAPGGSFVPAAAAATAAARETRVPAAKPARVAVEGVRIWSSPASTRVVFDLTGSVQPTLTRARDPERVIVDVPHAHLDSAAVRLPEPQGALKGVRVAQRDARTLRIVFDVEASTQSQTFIADPNARYGWRLVVDLKPATAVARAADEPRSPSVAATPATPATRPPATARPPVAPAPAAAAATPGDGARDADPAPRPSRTLPAGRDLVVAVDAGHGGVDPGALGKRGTREKDVTLAIARTLAARLNDEPGLRAVLTRSGDYFVPLRERIRRARAANADLFLSIHADAVADRSVAGGSVFILSPRGASSEAARRLAERENAADLVGGVKIADKDPLLASVLLDLSQNAAMAASQVAAEKVLDELNEVTTVRRSRVQQAGFVVLKSPDIPSMLIETAFITNPGDERRLRDPRHQRRIAEAILSGVRAYFRENPPPGTRVAAVQESRAAGAGGAGTLNR